MCANRNTKFWRMMVTLLVTIMTIDLITTMRMTETKTTETAAEGKCQSPARHVHVVMIMGSCPSVLTRCLNVIMGAPNACPNWLKEFGNTLTNNIGETITGVKTELKADIQEVKEDTNRELVKINSAVSSLQIASSENASKVELIEKEMDRIKKIRSEVVVAPANNYSKEDVEQYLVAYKEMLRTIGLCPFTLADFKRIKEFLIASGNTNPTKDEVLTANLCDFMSNDMGMSPEAIEALVVKIELMWVKKMTFKDMDPDNLTIFVRFTDVSGKKTCFHHAKAMNRSAVNNNVETRRLVLDVIPQLEARFAMLNKMSWRVRDDAKRNCNMSVHTRIELINNTLELQVKEPDEQYHHTIDLLKEYPGTDIPGIEYDRKTTEKRPEVFKFTGTKTPPGRNRVNNPRAAIRHLEENPSHHPRQRLELGNATLRGANTEPLGIRPKPIPPKDDANGANSIQQIFRGNFIDLDQIDTGSVVITAPIHPKSKVDSQNTRVLDFSNGNSAPTLPVLAARQEGDCFAELDPLHPQSKKTFYTKGHGSLVNIPAAAGSSSAMTKLMEAANRSQSEENLSKSRGQKRSNHPTTESQQVAKRPPGRPRKDSIGVAKAKADKAEGKGKTGAIPKTASKKKEDPRTELKEARADNPNNIGPDEDVVEDELILALEVKSKEDDLDFDAI